MAEAKDKLQQYVSDMVSLEEHILDALERQSGDDRVKNNPSVAPIVNKMRQMMDDHTSKLKEHLDRIGGDAGSPVKEAVSDIAGMAAGMYDKVREDPVSKMLRDDYTALNLNAMGYTLLHTTAIALNDRETAELALRHLNHLTPIIVDLSQLTPRVAAQELSDDGIKFDMSMVDQAIRNTQQAWSAEHVKT